MRSEQFEQYLRRRQIEHGPKFDASALDAQYIPFYDTGIRIKVLFSYGETCTGTVGATTGWRPCFLLMRRRTDHGSSRTLGAGDRIIAVQRGREYIPVR